MKSHASGFITSGNSENRGLNLDMEAIESIRMSNNNKKRFSDEQIKSLEFMFEAESRPESRMKQRLADELGLQPRQVAIWFQNRRARSKNKQIEHEYNKLKAEFEKLASNYELLKRENQSLLVQLQKLKDDLGESEKYDTTESKEGPSKINEPLSDNKGRNVESSVENIAVMSLEEHTESSGNWCGFDSGFLDESSPTSQWWELWS